MDHAQRPPAPPDGAQNPRHANAILSLESYGVAFGQRVILAEIDFALPPRGVTGVMGPSGTGKSTLLRSLAGLNVSNSRFHSWGRAEFAGAVLGAGHVPSLVLQDPQHLGTSVLEALAGGLRSAVPGLSPLELRHRAAAELERLACGDLVAWLDRTVIDLPVGDRRRVAILREAVASPPLLMIDEPTTGLDDDSSAPVLELVRMLGRERCVLVVLHNQQHARAVAERILLLAGGRIQADADVTTFFEQPPTPLAEHFVRTGSCDVPSPDAQPEDLAEDAAAPPPLPLAAQIAVRAEAEYRGPRGFKWIVPGRVGSTPLPGAVVDIEHDLASLRVVGVTSLITLTRRDLPQESLRRHGLRNLHLPIYDRDAPAPWQMRMLARRMTTMLDRGEVLAVHCRAGIGRTGTILAGWLIAEGLTADAALDRIRRIDPAFVQTDEQEAFLHAFEAHLLSITPA
ncbi:ATP-binding cassette domain-containing protein [Dokdonella ginsengisoli]|uniref:ATP-binding cassette domain-containing protein n=1 Tax=Dokdonella ginsengisoli TaxID=363846 RepID=A0ABV9QZ46_9GAMM